MTVRPRAALRTAVGVLLLMTTASVAAPVWAASDTGTGTPLTVTIPDGSTSTPTPAATTGSATSGSPPASGGSRGGVSTTTSVGGVTAPDGGGAGPAGSPAAGETSAGGGLYVGGLNGWGTPQLDPGDGLIHLWFTVRNASASAVDATATFWMDAPAFVTRIDSEVVDISALQPGESRFVSTTLHGGGQWAVLNSHVTFTPPESVDGATLTPVTRDALVPLFPWLIVMGAVVVLMVVLSVRVTRSAFAAVPAMAAS